jgi:hypothetical protein
MMHGRKSIKIRVYVYYILLKMFDLSINVHKAKLPFVSLRNMLLNTVCVEGHFQRAKGSR